jgi:hypothetical protein
MTVIPYRKRPIVVPTVLFDGENFDELREFTGDQFRPVDPQDRGDDPEIIAEVMDTLHSTWVGVKQGQSIVRGVQGEFYPIDAEVLSSTYETVEA